MTSINDLLHGNLEQVRKLVAQWEELPKSFSENTPWLHEQLALYLAHDYASDEIPNVSVIEELAPPEEVKAFVVSIVIQALDVYDYINRGLGD